MTIRRNTKITRADSNVTPISTETSTINNLEATSPLTETNNSVAVEPTVTQNQSTSEDADLTSSDTGKDKAVKVATPSVSTYDSKSHQPIENGWDKNSQGQNIYYQHGELLSGRQYVNLPTIPNTDASGSTNWYLMDNGVVQSGVQQWAGTYYYFNPVTYLRVDDDYVRSQWGLKYMFGKD
ncbi:mannosyl-glycoprotein endo-beta-N-acetylglucosamidase, partial [Limosilactobacillus agrestis]|nr:mannosyl-glycoprotein endo-beta-N-acetylglucosamidase [Limosilactobacillus agrestis]